MKRTVLLWLLCLLMAVCTACGSRTQEPKTQIVDISGQSTVITFDAGTNSAGTISTTHGDYTFAYDTSGTLTITYPDGYVYTQRNLDGGFATPADYDPKAVEAKGYLNGLSLSWGIERAMDSGSGRSKGGPSPLLALVLLALGAWNLCAPRSAWWLARGLWYRNAEPSDLALGLYRAGGGLLILVGIICAIAAL